MDIARAALSLVIATPFFLGTAFAQSTTHEDYTVTTRPTYDGYTTKDSDGYSVTTRRTYNGYTTKDNQGNSVSCRRIYNGGVTCRHIATRPTSGEQQETPEPQETPDQ
ncbi:MAG TPA: hypothetical protein VF503_31430 [Sphingobium sp.]|uniref:hypothetical protein n=1 Tax=Sphingobium sp. TaxID=1912891 RepID=UPI002ED2CF7C